VVRTVVSSTTNNIQAQAAELKKRLLRSSLSPPPSSSPWLWTRFLLTPATWAPAGLPPPGPSRGSGTQRPRAIPPCPPPRNLRREFQSHGVCAPVLKKNIKIGRKDERTWTSDTYAPYDDGHQWRKYGEKKLSNSNFPRFVPFTHSPSCPTVFPQISVFCSSYVSRMVNLVLITRSGVCLWDMLLVPLGVVTSTQNLFKDKFLPCFDCNNSSFLVSLYMLSWLLV